MSNRSNDAQDWLPTLLQPEAYPHPIRRVEQLETHISRVFLTGDWAYKLKKPVNFDFLDFSSLELRHAACLDELRLNRRTAPEIYESVVTLNRSSSGFRWNGDGPVAEYAVRMRQFSQEDLLLARVKAGNVTMEEVDRLGIAIADFHRQAEQAPSGSRYGTPELIRKAVIECFNAIDSGGEMGTATHSVLEQRQWCDEEFERLRPHFESRRRNGFIRECHGDLHLRNIVVLKGVPRLFDALEFNAELRWIDVISDIAFLMMDLHDHRSPGFAWRVMNQWLEQAGDFDGLHVLRYYFVYRALVRAKVAALRLSQSGLSREEIAKQHAESAGYLSLAREFCKRLTPAIILMHGLSGSGKSVVARELASELGAVRCRSDVERKRLCGAWPVDADSVSAPAAVYSPEATSRTYDRLLQITDVAVSSGYSIIVDAAFLKQEQRHAFARLAELNNARFLLISCEAPDDVLDARVRSRAQAGRDPSDATLQVLELQRRMRDPITAEELAATIRHSTAGVMQVSPLVETVRHRLSKAAPDDH